MPPEAGGRTPLYAVNIAWILDRSQATVVWHQRPAVRAEALGGGNREPGADLCRESPLKGQGADVTKVSDQEPGAGFYQGCWQGAWRRRRQGAKSTSQLGCWQGTRDCRADPGTVEESIDRGTAEAWTNQGTDETVAKPRRECVWRWSRRVVYQDPKRRSRRVITEDLSSRGWCAGQLGLHCWAVVMKMTSSWALERQHVIWGPWFLKGALLIVSRVQRKWVSEDLSKESPGWRPASTGSVSGLGLAGNMQSLAWEPLESTMADRAFLELAVQEKSKATPGAPKHQG